MADERRGALPWRVAGALVVVAAVLAGLLGWLLVRRGDHVTAGLDAREQAAVDAASREMVNTQSFRLAHFDADFARALGGLTGEPLQDLTAKKAALRRALQRSTFDTVATVTQAAFEQARGANQVVLVRIKNYRVDKSGKRTEFETGRFEVTVTEVDGKWLMSDFTSVGLM
jgi:hypothetical protein